MKLKKWAALFAVAAMIGCMAGIVLAQELEKIDINTASVQELTQLKKIGPKIATAIVAYRELNGPFKSPEDIMSVKGIGKSVWELNKDRIAVGQLSDTGAGKAADKAIESVTEKAKPATEAVKSVTEKAKSATEAAKSAAENVKPDATAASDNLKDRVKTLEDKVNKLEEKVEVGKKQ